MTKKNEKYVVVLAHADGWGALSANKLVRNLHERYPDLGIYLVVSKATRDASGKIATKLDALKLPRELKENNLLTFFDQIDQHYTKFDEIPSRLSAIARDSTLNDAEKTQRCYELGVESAKLPPDPHYFTFKELAKRFCRDQTVHYTSRGGPAGGQEVAAIIEGIEKKNGHGPELLLSVDTMAILPEHLLRKYDCFSTHPGPLDTIKIAGMQGTLRSLSHQIFYDREGNLLQEKPFMPGANTHIKGTLFLQHPELDKGPPIETALVYVCPGQSAYASRDDLYSVLIDKILEFMPRFLDRKARKSLIAEATELHEKRGREKLSFHVPALDEKVLRNWQNDVLAVPDDSSPTGFQVIPNQILDVDYFRNTMREFFPGNEDDFDHVYSETFGQTASQLAADQDQSVTDPWARLLRGDPNVEIRRHDPRTGEVTETLNNTTHANWRSRY